MSHDVVRPLVDQPATLHWYISSSLCVKAIRYYLLIAVKWVCHAVIYIASSNCFICWVVNTFRWISCVISHIFLLTTLILASGRWLVFSFFFLDIFIHWFIQISIDKAYFIMTDRGRSLLNELLWIWMWNTDRGVCYHYLSVSLGQCCVKRHSQ